MTSCAFLDSASLLAQSAISVRLGRRASACSHTPLAAARRLPLSDINVQGSTKQASANASPTQVLQTIGVEQVAEDDTGVDGAAVHGLLVPRRAGRRRVSVAQQDGSTLQLTVSDAADHPVDALLPPLPCSALEQPLPSETQSLASGVGGPQNGGQALAPAPWPSLTGRADGVSDGTGPHFPTRELRPPPQPWLSSGGVYGSETSYSSSREPLQQHPQLPLPSGHHAVLEAQRAGTSGGGEVPHGYRGDADTGPCEEPPWGSQPFVGLLDELHACGTCQSLQRFLQLHRPLLSRSLLGHAVVHLSHLVAEDAPDGEVEWQIVASLLDDLTRELRPAVAAGRLSSAQLAAVTCALSKLRFYDGPLLREVAAAAQQRAAELTPRQAAGLIWAFARYQRDFHFALEPGWAMTLLGVVLSRLDTATEKELSMTLYGMALLGEEPPPAAVTPLLDALRAGLPQCGSQELSMAMWSLASMRIDPGSAWLEAFLARCEEAVRIFAHGSTLCNVVYGLAVLGRRPPVSWMRHFLWQAQRRMNTMDAQCLSMLAWALGRMRYRPDTRFLKALLRYAAMEMLRTGEATPWQQPERLRWTQALRRSQPLERVAPAQSRKEAARGDTLQAGSDGDARLRESREQQQEQVQRAIQLQALWREQQRQLRRRLLLGAPGRPVARNTERQRLVRPQQRPRAESQQQQHNQLPVQAYNNLLWACVRLSHRPHIEWMEALCSAVQPRLDAFPPRELAHMLWCLSRLDWCPHHDWMLDYFFAMRASLPQHRPADCVVALLALGRMCRTLGYRTPESSLVDELFWQLHPYLGNLQTTVLISVTQSVASIVPPLPPSRLVALLGALLTRVRQVGFAPPLDGTHHHHHFGEGLRADPGNPPPVAAVAALPPPGLTPRECVNAVVAVGAVMQRAGRVSHVRQLSGMLLQKLMQHADRVASELNPVDLVLLLQGVTAAGVGLRHEWLRRHEAQARRCLEAGALTPKHLRALQRAYKAVGYEAELLPSVPPEEDEQGQVVECVEGAEAGGNGTGEAEEGADGRLGPGGGYAGAGAGVGVVRDRKKEQ